MPWNGRGTWVVDTVKIYSNRKWYALSHDAIRFWSISNEVFILVALSRDSEMQKKARPSNAPKRSVRMIVGRWNHWFDF